MPRAMAVCSMPGCPEFTQGGRCDEHKREAERQRGSSTRRGYGASHRRRFRAAVLARDPVCVLCRQAPSRHADHHPLSRRELETAGAEPDDPRHGRGLCGPCHSRETAQAQPGGWHAR